MPDLLFSKRHENLGITMRVVFLLVPLALFLLSSCGIFSYESYHKTGFGIASWYGPDFHGKPTSSGEIYDMNRLTCAHREYPFGTKLRVTNVSNSKSVNCTVNDRGPFVSGRDLDLSYAAAKEIGLIGQGTTEVRIEYIGRDNSYIKEVRYLSDTGPFTIQVGSFKELSNASRLKLSLDLKYSMIYLTEAKIKGSRFYRVRIGKFSIKQEAHKLAKTLADEGYSVFIVRYEDRI
jgi:rare lipoprotein A